MDNITLRILNADTGEHVCDVDIDSKTHEALTEYAVVDILTRVVQDKEQNKYYGITYCIPCWKILLWIWKNTLCRFKWHLFDECLSSLEGRGHFLHCDACGLEVHISRIVRYEKHEEVREGEIN